MRVFVQSVFGGLTNGSSYALIGLGLVLYFRSSRVLNLAHGEVFTITGLVVVFAVKWGSPLLLAVVAGIAVAVLFTLSTERLLLRPRLHWPLSSLVILTLAVALTVRGLLELVVGTDPYTFPAPLEGPSLRIAGAVLTQQGLATIAVTVLLGSGVAWFFRRTVVGQAMSASADDPVTSALVGIRVGQMRIMSYALAAVLGGVTAVFLVPLAFVSYESGLPLLIKGFVAAALANMLRPGRAVLGGFALGVVEALISTYTNSLYRDPIVFGVLLIGVLALLGDRVRFGGVSRA